MAAVIDREIYTQLLADFQPKVIETKEEYEEARQALLLLMKNKTRTPEQTALVKLISALIKDFDNRHTYQQKASPLDMLQYLMESNDMKQSDLVGKVGSSGVVSEIVNGKRSISKTQAKVLAEIFNVSSALFI